MSERIEEIKEATKMLVVKAWKEEQSVTTVVTKINFLWAEYLTQLEAERDEAVRQLKDELKDVKQAHKQLVELIKKERAERDEAVRRAVEGERERIFDVIDDFFMGPNIVLDGGILKGYIREAPTPPTSDISSEGNSKQYE